MQSEEPPLSAYDFQFAGGVKNSYVFETDAGSTYEFTFKPSGDVFDEQDHFRNDIYEFSIILSNQKTARLPLADPLIALTVIAIFRDFYERQGTVVLYICDSSDNRQVARYRKFGSWFSRYQHLGFIKVDVQIPDRQFTIYSSLVVHKQYRYRDEVILAFVRIAERESIK